MGSLRGTQSRCATLLAGVAFLLPFGGAAAFGQSSDRPTLPPRPAAGSLASMDARLAAVLAAYKRGGNRAAAAAARAQRVRLSAEGALVLVKASGGVDAARAAVMAADGRVRRKSGPLLETLVPLPKLERLVRDGRVARVHAPALFVRDVVSEGVAVTRASLWHTGGFAGAGVKIAILDMGFQGYQPLLGAELPASVETHDLCDAGPVTGDTNHGTAVAEVVHDVAPSAQLRLICFDSELDLQPAVNAAAASGVSVIVHSVGWFNVGRGDGNGGPNTPDAAALSARQQGILWVNSAGNQAQKHWSGTWADADADDLLDWQPFTWFNQMVISSGESICATLKWDAWPATDQDFDFYLVDMSDISIVAGSEGFQTGTQAPTEEFCWQNPGPAGTFALAVARFSASTAPRFDVFYFGSSTLQFRVESGSISEPASSPATLAVGAACRTNSVVEAFSSKGPTIDGRPKPELVGPNAVSTASLGGSSSCANGFRGTSASAPHVGGLAALVKQRTPSLSPGGIAAYLEGLARSDDPVSRVVGLHPVLSGSPIAYSLASGFGEPGFANADGTTLPVLAPDTGSNSTPRFSPDGTKIAFSAKTDTQATELYVANPDGSGRVRLTTGGATGADWSSDGSKLFFIRGTEIWQINSDGTGLVLLTSSSEDPIGPLDVSPDGSKITYGAVDHIGGGFIQFGLFVVSSNGTDATKIAGGDGSGMGAHFSPNGAKIAFHRNGDIYSINSDGTGETQLTFTPFPEDDTDPVWTSDGDIVFVSDREATGFSWTQLYRMEANGTGLTRLTSRVGPSHFAAPEIGPSNAKPLAVDSPTIAGTLQVGRYVVASPVVWVGGSPFTVTRQWHRCDTSGGNCVPIGGANDIFYRLTAPDVSGTLRYTETATNGGGTTSAYFGLPTNVAPPHLVGEPWLNITSLSVVLTAAPGLWQGSPTALSYRWQRSPVGERETWHDISSGPNPARTLTAQDMGARIRVLVTASNAVGAATAVSPPTIVIGGQPVPAAGMQIDTSVQPFRILPGAWRGYPIPTVSWQWFRWPSGSSPAPIPDATGLTYQPTGADVGAILFAQEFAANSFGTGFVSSAVTQTIGLVSTGAPVVTGSAQVGQTLTSSQGTWTPSSGLSFTYRWQRAFEVPRWRDVPGATASSYVPSSEDRNAHLRVVVSASGGGSSASAASAPTAPVAP